MRPETSARGTFADSTRDLGEKFAAKFGPPATIYRAPGRVNLIGEHTDYNEGFVMPAAIGFYCQAAANRRGDDKVVIFSENFGESATGRLGGERLEPTGQWSDYALGVAWALQAAGCELPGANIYVRGEIPLGAGLSSSAAFEVAVASTLLDLAGVEMERKKIAALAQRAENEFVGARCGIMDQFVCCLGRAGHALLLDCRSLAYEAVPLPEQVRLVICNTMVKHEIAEGEYNRRRQECEEGVQRLATARPGIRALRDVGRRELDEQRERLGETVYRRCRHVVSENERVPRAAEALRRGEVAGLGELMAESHRSLRDDYEVSCAELDLLVEIASGQEGVYGARMTGGGFGGCTVNVVERSRTAEFERAVAEEYERATGRRPDIFVCDARDGAERVLPAAGIEPIG